MLDLKHPEGSEVARRLIANADVLLEGFRPGVMERLGLGPEPCRELNPSLVYARMTGWGQDGPRSQMPGHDINYIALSGVLDAIGRAGEPPLAPLNLLADFGGGGMLLAFGVLAAIFERMTSGKGQVIDAAMVDGVSLLMTTYYGLFAQGKWSLERGTNFIDSGSHFFEVYETADGGYISIGAYEPKFYENLLAACGLEDTIRPPRPVGQSRLARDEGATRGRSSSRRRGTNGASCSTTPKFALLRSSRSPRRPTIHITSRGARSRSTPGSSSLPPHRDSSARPLRSRDPLHDRASTRMRFSNLSGSMPAK